MSKKSIRSKGFRKPQKQTKGYSPKEKKAMIIGFAAIVVIIVAALVLPDFIQSFSLLKVKDGVVQGVEDNWLLCNVGTPSKPKYRKLAEVNEPEGYALAEEQPTDFDKNLPHFLYTPEGESPASQIYVQPGAKNANELVENYRKTLDNFVEITYLGDVVEGEVNGAKTYSFIVEYRMEDYSSAIAEAEAQQEAAEAPAEAPAEEATEAPAEEAAEAPAEEAAEAPAENGIVYDYTQNVVLYVDSEIDGQCVVINAMNTGADESVYADRDAMMAEIADFANCIVLEK